MDSTYTHQSVTACSLLLFTVLGYSQLVGTQLECNVNVNSPVDVVLNTLISSFCS